MNLKKLNNNDLEWIDKAFRFTLACQAGQIKGAAECGSPETMRDNLESFEEMLKTYTKITNRIRRIQVKRKENK